MKRLLVTLVLAIAALSAPIGVSAQSTVAFPQASAETQLANLINREHARVCGSGMYRSFLHDNISRWRSTDMVQRDYFSHTVKGTTKNVFSYLGAYHIRGWLFAGENIAWNNYPDSMAGSAAYTQFMNSAGHRALIRTCRFNSFGVGAIKGADGKKMFTVVFTQQPIRRVSTSYTYSRYGPGTQYAIRKRLPYYTRMVQFDYSYDRSGRRWYYERSGYGWGWVPGWQVR